MVCKFFCDLGKTPRFGGWLTWNLVRVESALLTVWQPLEQRYTMDQPPMFLVGLCGLGMGKFSHCVKRTDSKIAQRQGSSPPKPLGVFLLCHARSRTVRGSNAPNPAADKKRVQDGGNGFPNPVQIRKACGGREPSSRGEMVSNPFHAKVGIFPGEAIPLSYPLGVGGRLGEIY